MSDPGPAGTGSRPRSGRWRRILRSHHAVVQLARYAVIGGGATLLQAALYALLTDRIGVQPANAVAWAICTLLSTIGHRWLTFGLRRRDTHRDLAVGIATSLVALGATAAALALLGPHDGFVGAAVVFGVLTIVGCLRFIILRYWFVGRENREVRTVDPGISGANEDGGTDVDGGTHEDSGTDEYGGTYEDGGTDKDGGADDGAGVGR